MLSQNNKKTHTLVEQYISSFRESLLFCSVGQCQKFCHSLTNHKTATEMWNFITAQVSYQIAKRLCRWPLISTVNSAHGRSHVKMYCNLPPVAALSISKVYIYLQFSSLFPEPNIHYGFCIVNQNSTKVSKHTVVSMDSVAKKLHLIECTHEKSLTYRATQTVQKTAVGVRCDKVWLNLLK